MTSDPDGLRRRQFLVVAAAVGGMGLAGCGGRRSSTGGRRTETDTTGEPTTDPPSLTDLSFTATVENQPSPDAPATVRVRLGNPTATDLSVKFGQSLLFSAEASPLDGYEGIHLILVEEVESETHRDGCWRDPNPSATRTVWSYRPPVDLPAGEAIQDRYAVLAGADAERCPPPGEYRFTNEIVRKGYTGPRIGVTVSVREDGRLSVAGTGPGVSGD
jgi:hypothetical protein